jgi:hypothetical protein
VSCKVICDIFIIRKVAAQDKTDVDDEKKNRKRGTWVKMGWLSCNGESSMTKSARHWLLLKIVESDHVSQSIKNTVREWMAQEVARGLPSKIEKKKDTLEYYINRKEKMELQRDALFTRQLEHLSRLGGQAEQDYLEHSKAFGEFFGRYAKAKEAISEMEIQISDMDWEVKELEKNKRDIEQSESKKSSTSNKFEAVVYAHLSNQITNAPQEEVVNQAKESFEIQMEQKRDKRREEREARKAAEPPGKSEDLRRDLVEMLMAAKEKRYGGASSSRRGSYDDDDDILVSVPYHTRLPQGRGAAESRAGLLAASIAGTDDTQELVI